MNKNEVITNIAIASFLILRDFLWKLILFVNNF